MEDEQAASHDLCELLEDTHCQVNHHAEHLIADAIVTDANQTWLQRAAQVVQKDFLLLDVQRGKHIR